MASLSARRDTALDFLRGYLIFVVVVDHLRDEPHLFMFLTGGTHLWISAAEGFVLISGFLVGSKRGAEARAGELRPVARRILFRAATLAASTVIVSDLLLALAATTKIAIPETDRCADFGPVRRILFTQVLQCVYGEHQILAAYAVFLAASPLLIACLVRGRLWLIGAVSASLWALGLIAPSPLSLTDAFIADLSWQSLFVIGVVAGFYRETLARSWIRLGPRARRGLVAAAGAVTIAALSLSSARRFYGTPTRIEHMLFAHVRLGPGRLCLAVIALVFAYAVVVRFEKWLLPKLGPIFVPLGRSSLYVFIVQALLLFPFVGEAKGRFWMASLHVTVAVVLIWALVRFRILFKVIPR